MPLPTLASKLANLRDRETELQESLRKASLKAPTPQQLTDTRDQLRTALDETSDRKRKTLLQALVHEVRVKARDHIEPVFRVPFTDDQDEVRPLVGTVPPAGFEPAHPL